ncbi:MAG: hypothetical protein MJK13_14600 [Pseudomonadales bacterium]|nr:hypothetical protein [Pseudomonadales bacterium]
MEVRVTGWRSDTYFSQMKNLGVINDGWSAVLSCPICSQTWRVDEYDKIQSLFALKIDSPNDLSEAKFLGIHKSYLIKEHGGESSKICLMARCGNNAVKDFAFCADCLITKQGVYQ